MIHIQNDGVFNNIEEVSPLKVFDAISLEEGSYNSEQKVGKNNFL